MEKKDIEELIEKRILEAKLTVTETRLNHLIVLAGGLLAFFGIIVPLWLTNTSTDKTDKAIASMEQRFKELAGEQLRKPDIDCFVEGSRLEGNTLTLSGAKSAYIIEVKNVGDAPARNLRIRLYTKINTVDGNAEVSEAGYGWGALSVSDEPGYTIYELHEWQPQNNLASIPPKDSIRFKLNFAMPEPKDRKSSTAIIKVFYEQPDPKRIQFTINFAE